MYHAHTLEALVESRVRTGEVLQWRLSLEDFDHGVVQSYLTGQHRPTGTGNRDLTAAIHGAWTLSDEDEAVLRDRLTQVLTTGDFHYVVAAQRFTPPWPGVSTT
jgi:hypothetical protein